MYHHMLCFSKLKILPDRYLQCLPCLANLQPANYLPFQESQTCDTAWTSSFKTFPHFTCSAKTKIIQISKNALVCSPIAPQCPACKRSVFAPEAYMASERTPFHKICLKCSSCKKSFTPASLNEHKKKLFCPLCYKYMFNPQSKEISNIPLINWWTFCRMTFLRDQSCKFCLSRECLLW